MLAAAASCFFSFLSGSLFFEKPGPSGPPLGAMAAYSAGPSVRGMVQSLSGPKRLPRLRSGAGLPAASSGGGLDAEWSNRPSNIAEPIADFHIEVLARTAHHRSIRGMRFAKRHLFYNQTGPNQRPTAGS